MEGAIIPSSDSPMKTHNVEESHGHSHGIALDQEFLVCGVNMTPLILLLAIGFHSIFEGIALGMFGQV